MYPLKFEPILKQTLWGGDKIISFKQLNDTRTEVGESWEISAVEGSESIVAEGPDKGMTLTEVLSKYREELLGEANYARFGVKFPLLVKFIDARQDLSIQVHPSDELAKKRHNSMGKTEMWYVIGADKGAKLRSGFSEQITPKEYKDRVYNNTITEVLQEYDIQPGDVFFLPAGRVHSIGAGAFIAEIQQTSDVTYRIYDFDRKDSKGNARELHTDLAREAINFEVLDDYRTQYDVVENEPIELVACPYFTTSLYDMTEEITCDYSELDSFVIFVCVEGSCTLYDNEKNEVSFKAGETVLMPASIQEVTIVPNGKVKLLETYV
ncbi:MAG: type I phosphomannose isomerase catalytic subunit [Bacteroides graminisolvens]|jgi:mannose-6-phosphate isomerase, type 1 (EC 5.3.1.8)|uniref:type I phosphomannose isomerase catalytic subunit n=1 Tax=Bacteroides graminisolvens TaxID=477666 RepID=UPI000E9C3C14|nr:type I phosphomannose isomerase catalytic subunit [Bacteroides graminisolvens]MBP7292946.1 class I mannose-6-phosphate isomerase [Bacteroides sp.]MBP9552946.1 class I mannose-6-phosphate isomerase [Bacteroides sp.]MCD8474487.1 class I mannose-6-phosphate isomerase [Bacteroides graminisolvens]MDD3210441.1 mannose-6-phosphate isomerase [Bacteroides graminisolvens]HAZ58504.1 mannose-6-phosphate isomerase [Bacteroides graminisolvens]